MTSASPFSIAAFSILTLLVLTAVIVGCRRAGYPLQQLGVLMVPYLILPALLAGVGALDRYNPLPAPALVLVLLLTLLTIGMTLSSLSTRLVAQVSLGAVIVLQSFRIAVEWLLHRLYLEGVVPVQMTYSGRNWDILTGLTGLAVGLWLLRGGTVPGWLLWVWNVLGLGLLVNIVAIAILSTAVPFRAFLNEPANRLPSIFPFVWLPSFLVQVALGSHLLIFRKLRSSASAG